MSDDVPDPEAVDAEEAGEPVRALPVEAGGENRADVLAYAAGGAAGSPLLDPKDIAANEPVTIGVCLDMAGAEMVAAAIGGAGIGCHLLNRNTNVLGAYAGASGVELQVRAADAAAAREIFLRHFSDTDYLEPAEDDPSDRDGPDAPPDADTALDAKGRPVELAVAAAFDRPRALLDAATTLGAARVECFLPTLVPRGDRPPGEGKRFILRVRREDLERALSVLAKAEADGDEEEDPRCPKCGSWQVHPVAYFWAGVLRTLTLGLYPAPPPEADCLRCGHRWPVERLGRE